MRWLSALSGIARTCGDSDRTGELGRLPILLADTVATYAGVKLNAVTPATVTRDDVGTFASSVRVTRKLEIVGRFAYALAGDGDLIREIKQNVVWLLPEWELAERPCQMFTEHVNLYKRTRRGRVHALGAWAGAFPTPSGSHVGVELCTPSVVRDLPNLSATAIGTGGARLLKFADALDADIARSPTGRARMSDFLRAANSINTHVLAREMALGVSDATGGYIEFALFDPESYSWFRGWDTLHLFCKVQDGMLNIHDRCFAYSKRGHVLSAFLDAGELFTVDFDFSGEAEPSPQQRRWERWKPEMVTVIFFQVHDDSEVESQSFTLAASQHERVFFSLTSEQQGFGLERSVSA